MLRWVKCGAWTQVSKESRQREILCKRHAWFQGAQTWDHLISLVKSPSEKMLRIRNKQWEVGQSRHSRQQNSVWTHTLTGTPHLLWDSKLMSYDFLQAWAWHCLPLKPLGQSYALNQSYADWAQCRFLCWSILIKESHVPRPAVPLQQDCCGRKPL